MSVCLFKDTIQSFHLDKSYIVEIFTIDQQRILNFTNVLRYKVAYEFISFISSLWYFEYNFTFKTLSLQKDPISNIIKIFVQTLRCILLQTYKLQISSLLN